MSGASTLVVRVARRRQEAEGICSFELVRPDGSELPPFEAGAHVDVQVPGGPVRPYSLCGDPADTRRYRIGVLREPASRGGSAGMHERLHEGELLTIGLPRNLFPLSADAGRHLLLAGGIGITPLMAMALQLRRRGADFMLHYAARSAARLAFGDELAAALGSTRLRLHLDDGDAAQRLDLASLLASPEAGRHVYVCGPQGFIDAALGTARRLGWPEAQLHCESFGAPAAPAVGDAPFELRLARTQRVVAVPAGRTATQALAEAGVFVATSCEQGVCGTCLTTVLEGECDHRDQYLTPEEQAANDCFLPCCSRARGERLVIDL